MIILSIIFIQYKSLSDQNLKMFTFFISEPLKGDNVTDGRFEHYPRTSFHLPLIILQSFSKRQLDYIVH